MEKESLEIGQRLKDLRIQKKATLEEFYGPITPYYNNFSSIENGNRKMGKRLSGELIEYYKLNPEWLFKGRQPVYNDSKRNEGVPYFDLDFSNQPFNESIIANEEPEFYVNFKPFNDCTAYLTIYGDSMYPKYTSGDIISIKKLPNKDVILWGEAYLVITNESANNLCTVKIIHPHKNPDKIILRASNPNYAGDTVIDKKSILELYSIKGKITRNTM